MPCGTAGRLVRDVDIHCLEFVVQRDVDHECRQLDAEQIDPGGKNKEHSVESDDLSQAETQADHQHHH